MERGTRPMVTH